MKSRTILAMVAAVLVSLVPAAAETLGVGKPHTCAEFYPQEAVDQNHGGTISLAITITTEGKVENPRILNSSGYPELDAAALTCVRGWMYKPAIRNGNPVASDWRALVQFGAASGVPDSITELSADVRKCVRESRVVADLPASFLGITDIALGFAPDKEPQITVLQASGNDALDAKAAACAKASPAMAKAAIALRGRSWVLSYNWSVMRSMGAI